LSIVLVEMVRTSVSGLLRRAVGASKEHQLPHHLSGALGRVQGIFEMPRARCRRARHRHFEVGENHGEHVVEVVRDSRRQLPHRFYFLRDAQNAPRALFAR
jgi:hypothetical protein